MRTYRTIMMMMDGWKMKGKLDEADTASERVNDPLLRTSMTPTVIPTVAFWSSFSSEAIV
jgi:hypothetical protein